MKKGGRPVKGHTARGGS